MLELIIPYVGMGATRNEQHIISYSTRSVLSHLGPDHILKQPHLSWIGVVTPLRKWMGNIARPVRACGGPRPIIPPELVMPPMLLTAIKARWASNACVRASRVDASTNLYYATRLIRIPTILHSSNNVRVLHIQQPGLPDVTCHDYQA